MLNMRNSLKSGISACMAGALALGAFAPVAARAQDRRFDRHDDRRDHRGPPSWRGDRHWDGPDHRVVIRARPNYYRPYYVPRSRFYHSVRVYRPYGVVYPGFGFYYSDTDAFRFLGLTALSVAAFSALNEQQQRAHEEAFVEATSSPLGEPIIWDDGGSNGSVTAVRDGQTADGRQCREFRQNVVIDGRNTEAYGTACLQPDGSWEVVNDAG